MLHQAASGDLHQCLGEKVQVALTLLDGAPVGRDRLVELDPELGGRLEAERREGRKVGRLLNGLSVFQWLVTTTRYFCIFICFKVIFSNTNFVHMSYCPNICK